MEKEDNLKSSKNDVDDNKFILSLLKGVRDIYVLWIISKQKIHGYGIVSQLNKIASTIDENKKIHTSTIYPILYNLEKEGLITSTNQLNNKHKVKIYEITQDGIIKLNNIKECIKTTKENDSLISFIDEMIFDDELFTLGYEGV